MTDLIRLRKISTRRSAEGTALALAWLVGLFAWALVDLATGNDLKSGLIPLGCVGALLLAAHIVVRWQAPFADPVILPAVAMLNLLGLAMIHRLDVANQKLADIRGVTAPTPDVYLQITWLAVGLLLFCTVLFIINDHRKLQRLTFTCGVAGILMLFLPCHSFQGLALKSMEHGSGLIWRSSRFNLAKSPKYC
jgi:hypothetical protein